MTARARLKPVAGAIAAVAFAGFGMAPSIQAAGTQGSQSAAADNTTHATSQASGTASSKRQATMVDMRASKLMGKSVRTAQGKDLGELSDMIVDLSKNRIHYAIVERGGILGVGEKATAVPISQFRSGAREGDLVLNVTEQQLKDAPALQRNVEWNDPRTWDNLGQYYHRTLGMPGAEMPEAADRNRFQRASEVLGMDVIDKTGDEVGEIEDFVVNLSNGSIRYAVLEFDRAWNPVDKLVALPMASLHAKAGSKDAVINMTREQLANAPAFDRDRWPDLTDGRFRDRVAGYGRDDTTGMERPGGSQSAKPGAQGMSGTTQGSGTTSGQPR